MEIERVAPTATANGDPINSDQKKKKRKQMTTWKILVIIIILPPYLVECF